MAAPHPDVQERGTFPRAGPHGDQHDGLEDGFAAARARECRGPVSTGVDEEPRPGTLDRRGSRGDTVRLVPAVRRAADPRRNRLEVELGPQVDRTDGADPGPPTH